MAETFEQIQRRLLSDRLTRMQKLIDLNAPPTIIARCVAPVVHAAAAVYGIEVYARLGEEALDAEKIRLGFCPSCSGDPKPISKKRTPFGESWEMCDDCLGTVAEMERDNPADPVSIHDLLSHLGAENHRTVVQINQWSADEKNSVEHWALAEHVAASSEDATHSLPRPDVLARTEVTVCERDCPPVQVPSEEVPQ